MNKITLLAFLLIPLSVSAQDSDPSVSPSLVYESPKVRHFNPRESHWLTTLGFEGMKYPVPFSFNGAEKDIKPNDQELWGGRIGFGGEVYLGKGFMTSSRVEGYFMGTLFSKTQNAGPEDDDIEVGFYKRTGQIMGIDLAQSLGFMFDMKTKNPFMDEWSYLTVEPFIEAGLGWAKAYNRDHYHYDTGSIQEDFKQTVDDQLLNARIGAGVNFTSAEGYFFYLRGTINRYDLVERKSEGFSDPQGQATPTSLDGEEKDVKIDPVTVYAIGGGYKF